MGFFIYERKYLYIMKILISERQYSLLVEQSDAAMDRRGNALLNATGIRSDKDYAKVDKVITQSLKSDADPHTVAMVLGIGAAFIPVIGPFISAGIGLLDAALYYKEGDKTTGNIAAAFALIPIVGVGLSKIPGIKQLGAKGMAGLASKLKGNKPLTATETLAVNEIKQNSQAITTTLNQASQRLSGVAVEVKAMRGPYIQKFGLDKYDQLLSQYITGKIPKSTFITTLNSGTFAHGPWVDFAAKFGVKFSQGEVYQIQHIAKSIKNSVTQSIRIDTYLGKNIDYAIKKVLAKDVPDYLKTAQMYVDGAKREIVVIVDNLGTSSEKDIINMLVHEIGHLKDGAVLRSPKFAQSFNKIADAGFDTAEKFANYVQHPWEIVANTAMALQQFADNTKDVARVMGKERVLNALDNIIQFSGGNVTELSDDAYKLIYGDEATQLVVNFYQQMSKVPAEYTKIMAKLRRQAMDLKSKIKIAL